MLESVFEAVAKQAAIEKALAEEICIGNVLGSGAVYTTSRMAGFLAVYPDKTFDKSINRLCSSGLG